jgi:hypothetical protein
MEKNKKKNLPMAQEMLTSPRPSPLILDPPVPTVIPLMPCKKTDGKTYLGPKQQYHGLDPSVVSPLSHLSPIDPTHVIVPSPPFPLVLLDITNSIIGCSTCDPLCEQWLAGIGWVLGSLLVLLVVVVVVVPI